MLSAIQVALLAEASINIYGSVAIFQDPGSLLVLLLPASTPQTAPMRTQAQWAGALTLGVTLPILLCIPDGPDQTIARRNLYITFMGFEACMVAITIAQYLSNDSGFTDNALFGTMGVFAFFTSLRILFLYIKPSWIQARSKQEKLS